jgi:hypothetical protein
MHAAQTIIDHEGFSPHLTAMLHEVFAEVWSTAPSKTETTARSIAASLCAMARAGQHSRARLRAHAHSALRHSKHG